MRGSGAVASGAKQDVRWLASGRQTLYIVSVARRLLVLLLVLLVGSLASAQVDQVWSFTFGGANTRVADMVVDGNDDAVVLGTRLDDLLIRKVAPNGGTRWEQTFSVDGFVLRPRSVTLDPAGNIYVLAFAENISGNAFQLLSYSPTGAVRWTLRLGGPTQGGAFRMGVLEAKKMRFSRELNRLVVVGETGLLGNSDWAIFTVDAGGQVGWIRGFAGVAGGNDRVNDLAVRADGLIAVVGKVNFVPLNLTATAAQTAWFSANGVFRGAARYVFTTEGARDEAVAAAFTSDGETLVAVNAAGPRDSDIVVLKYSVPGLLIGDVSYDRSERADRVVAIAVDGRDNIRVIGSTTDPEPGQTDFAQILFDQGGMLLDEAWYDSGEQKNNAPVVFLQEGSRSILFGTAELANNARVPMVIRTDAANTTIWSYLGDGTATTTVTAAALDRNGGILIAGSRREASGQDFMMLTKLQRSIRPISITLDPPTLIGGLNGTVRVAMNDFAPASGWPIQLTSSSPLVALPANPAIPRNGNVFTGVLRTSTVTTERQVTLTVTSGGQSRTATLTLQAVRLASFSVSSNTVNAGRTFTGTVRLSAPAPAGGALVAIASSNDACVADGAVTVPAGQTEATVTLTAKSGDVDRSTTLTASYNGASFSQNVTAQRLRVLSVVPVRRDIYSTESVLVVVTLSAPAPVARRVSLTTTNGTAVTLPEAVGVAAGAVRGTFTVVGKVITTTQDAPITARLNGLSSETSITVRTPAVATFTSSRSVMRNNETATLTVTLNYNAPPGGTVVRIGGDPWALQRLSPPSQVTVPAGQKTVSFNVTLRNLDVRGTLRLNAAASDTQIPLQITATL